MRIVIGVLIGLGIVVAIGLKIRGPASNEAEDLLNESVVVSVHTVKATKQSISAQISAIGNIFPRTQATVSAKTSGQISRMELLKNRYVKADEILVTIESRDIRAQRAEVAAALDEARLTLRSLNTGTIPQTVAQNDKALRDAQANLNTARTLYERRRELSEKGGIAKKDVEAAQLALTLAENELKLAERTASLRTEALTPTDRALAESRVKQAEQRLATLDTQLSYASIRAPFSGVITDQFQFRGEFASPGAKLFTIADTSEVIVKVPFSDTVAAQLKVGNSATVFPLDQDSDSYPGKISLISRSSDLQSRTVEVWINLKNDSGKLRPGSAAKVVATTSQAEEAIVVPVSAVTLKATNESEGTVMTVDEQLIAHETKVMVGIRTLDRLQITAGLQGGETIVIEGNYALPDGTKVQLPDVKPEPASKDPKEKQGSTP